MNTGIDTGIETGSEQHNDAIWHGGKWPTRALVRIFLLLGINIFGNGLVMAYTLIYLNERRAIDLKTAGAILGVMGLASIVSGPATGALSDRFGAHIVMAVTMALGAIGYGLLGFATTVTTATFAAFVCGLSAAWGAQNALVTGLTTKDTRPRAFAMQRAVINACIGLGALVGGVIADPKRPSSFDVLFRLDVVTFVVATVMVLRLPKLIPKSLLQPHHKPASQNDVGGYRQVTKDRNFMRILPYDFATGFTFAVAFDVLPAAVRKLDISNAWIGLLFGINTATVVLVQMPMVRLVSGRRRMPLLAMQFGIFIASFFVTMLAGAFDGTVVVALFALSMISFALAESIMGAVRAPMIADFATPSLLGRYGALTQTTFQLGMAVGRPIGARALSHSAPTLWFAGIAVAIAAAGYLLRFEHHLPLAMQRAVVSQ
jgi:MFS family permease